MRLFAFRVIRLLLLIVILILVMTCCGYPTPERIKMERAEALMDSRPDSSLMILESINPALLKNDEDKALYALLTTRAQDKNYIDATSDSLISIAVKYYDKTDDIYYRMLSHYYYGTVKLYAQDYSESIVSMHKSLKYAKQLDDNFWMGLCYRSIKDAYHATYNNKEELIYAQKEYLHTKKCGKQPYINYALLDLAYAYNNDNYWNKTLALCEQIVDSAKKYKDLPLLVDAKRVEGISSYGKNKYNDFVRAFKYVCNSGMSNTNDSANLSLAYVETGNIQKASSIINKIIPDTTLENQILHCNIMYKIYKSQNMNSNALFELEKINCLLNAVMQKRISQNINQSVINYFTTENQIAEKERKTSHKITLLIIMASILIIVIIAILFIVYHRREQEKVSKQIEAARQLKKLLSNIESDYSRIQIDYTKVQDNYSKIQDEYSKVKEDYSNVQNDYLKIQNHYDKARKSVITLLSERYKMLDELCSLTYENNNESVTKRRILNKVSSLIRQLKDDSKLLSELENLVNVHNSDLMIHFRNDLPGLKEHYLRLFLFSVLGFSDSSISVFLNKQKTSMVWDMRRPSQGQNQQTRHRQEV